MTIGKGRYQGYGKHCLKGMWRRWTEQAWSELAEAAHYDAKALARLCQISTRQLQREFRRSRGRSPQEWLNEQRILAARQLLLSGLPVKRVAFEVGFKYTSHFCQRFKSLNHMTPSEFVLHQNQIPPNVAPL